MKLSQTLKRFLKRLASREEKKSDYLSPPDYGLQEEHFLAQSENFRTGLWRALRIFYEYMRGFRRFRDVNNCITVFGSARFKEHHPYYRMARLVGRILAKNGFMVMTGGGPGIMEAANRGAKERGGRSIACNIRLPGAEGLEPPNPYVERRIVMNYFFVRKVMLTKYSLAFIVMPGGLGTMDELFEVMTLIQTHKLKNFPIILMGTDFWQPLMDFMYQTLLKNKTIYTEDMEQLLLTNSPEEALDHIRKYLRKNGSRQGEL